MRHTLSPQKLTEAVNTLERGGVIALPTETVYGLAGDAHNAATIERIFTIKGRPKAKPISVLIPSIDAMPEWASIIPDYALALAQAFWPGPMTLILPKQPHVHDILTGNSNTIGLRIPDNAIAQQVLEQFGALATPSANSSGQLSPTTAAHVQHDLGDQVDLILDGGICSLGMESTLIDCTGKQPKIRRQGFLTAEDITQATGLTTTQALSAAEKRLQYPVTSTSFAAIQEQLKTDTTAIVVVSRHKPTCRDVVLHDARVPHRLTTPVKTTAHRHWILMPQDATGFAHSFYEQLHYANTLLQGNAQGRIVVESLPNDHFIWRTLAMRLNSFLLASTDLN